MAVPSNVLKAGYAMWVFCMSPLSFYKHIYDTDSTTNHRGRLRNTEEHADCKVIYGPYHYNLHKTVLFAQSEYFRAALKPGNFKVGPKLHDSLGSVLTSSRRERPVFSR
jgi:hypothetical protein